MRYHEMVAALAARIPEEPRPQDVLTRRRVARLFLELPMCSVEGQVREEGLPFYPVFCLESGTDWLSARAVTGFFRFRCTETGAGIQLQILRNLTGMRTVGCRVARDVLPLFNRHYPERPEVEAALEAFEGRRTDQREKTLADLDRALKKISTPVESAIGFYHSLEAIHRLLHMQPWTVREHFRSVLENACLAWSDKGHGYALAKSHIYARWFIQDALTREAERDIFGEHW